MDVETPKGAVARALAWSPFPRRAGYAFDRADLLLAALLGLVAFAIAMVCAAAMPAGMYDQGDIWYDADPGRVLGMMTSRNGPMQYRNSVHPLFSLFNWLPSRALMAAGLQGVAAAPLVVAATGFLTVAVTALAARAIGLSRPAVAGLILILVTSSGYLSFFGFIETYAFAALTVALMLLVTAAAPSGRWLLWLAGSAVSLAGTVTNWTVGLIGLALNHPLRRAVLLGTLGLAGVMLLALLQQVIFPHARLFFIPSGIAEEATAYSTGAGEHTEAFWSPLSAIWSVWVGTIVANPAEVVTASAQGGFRYIVDNQAIALSAGPPARIGAVAAWLVLLALALLDGWREPRLRPLFLTLIGFLLCQTVLHLLYGRITFLYAGDHLPALILLAAFAWLSRFRMAAIAAGLALILLGTWANVVQLQGAIQAADQAIASAKAQTGRTGVALQ